MVIGMSSACRSTPTTTLDRFVNGYAPNAHFGQRLAELKQAIAGGQVYEGNGGSLRAPLRPPIDGFDTVSFLRFDEPLRQRFLSSVMDRPSDDARFTAVRLTGRDTLAPALAHGRIVKLIGAPTRIICSRNGYRRAEIWNTAPDAGVALFFRGIVGHPEPSLVIATKGLRQWLQETGQYTTDTLPCG